MDTALARDFEKMPKNQYQGYRDRFMLTLSKPKCSQIVNFYGILCEQKGDYKVFL